MISLVFIYQCLVYRMVSVTVTHYKLISGTTFAENLLADDEDASDSEKAASRAATA